MVEQDFEHELVNLKVDQEGEIDAEAIRKRDDLYESAIEVVLREGRGSCSLLQRALGIGYGRAARMIDYMAEDGIVGQHNGSSAREILMSMEDWELIKHSGGQSVAVADEESADTKYADEEYAEDEFLEEEEYLEADDDSEYEYEEEGEADAGDEDDWEEEGLDEESAEEPAADEYEEYEEATDGDLEDNEDVEYVYVDEEVEDYEDQEDEEEVLEPTLSLVKARKKAAVAANGANEEDLWDEYEDDDSWADEVDEELDS